jgi:hypothetical protein
VWSTVDIKRAHTADTFTAVVVEYERLLAFFYELLVEDVEHFEEGSVARDILHLTAFEVALVLRTILLPIFNGE